jgi:predicted amidohydrolase
MSFRLAVVQPLTAFGPDAREQNLAGALRHATEAARQGAQLVCFPESYPGPWRMPITWSPLPELRAIAREVGVHLVAGFAEPLDAAGRRCHNALALIGPDGRDIGIYRRTTPDHAPWIYQGGTYWDFDWVPADALPVFDTDLGRIGLLMCSEVYAPELARVLAVKGAELIVMPAGLMGTKSALVDTWRTLTWARAIENLAYTAICNNIVTEGEQGLAMVCSPEEIVLESRLEGVHVATVDLDRVRWLRDQQDRLVGEPKPWRTKPGNLRDWRRQAVFDANPELGQA